MYRVVIPYLFSGAQGRELEFALQGWKRHFREEHEIILVGEDLPWTPGVKMIESKRVPGIPGMYRQHLDYVSCFRKVREHYPDDKGFIFVADDVYAVNDFGINDVMVRKANARAFKGDRESTNGWQRDMWRTRDLLDALGAPHVNYTTHLPQWFDWYELERLWERFEMDQRSYVFENLYFNLVDADEPYILLNNGKDEYRLGIWERDLTTEQITQKMNDVVWVVNSITGYDYNLEKALRQHYYGE